MRVVLDTNVLVSGLLSPYGPPGEVARLVSSGEIVLCLDARILAEYDDVLSRPRLGLDPDGVAALLDYVAFRGENVAARPLPRRLPDADDEPFLEVAASSSAECLITGNARHYPKSARGGVAVVSPAEFVELFRAAGR